MGRYINKLALVSLEIGLIASASAQKIKVIVDQDTRGPQAVKPSRATKVNSFQSKRFLMQRKRFVPAIAILLAVSSFASAQPRRKVIINEDCSGPGGSNMQTILMMIQSPQVEVLGITVVSGDQWRDEEVAHTLRLLEIIGRTDIPVVPGALRESRLRGRVG
jgi:hypothetical protein